ncbi:hypothetical protein ACSBR2_030696 [Camellia fascicularis]
MSMKLGDKVGEYREGKGKSEPLLYMGGKLVSAANNSIGGVSHLSGDHVNEPFIGEDGVSGVLLHDKTAKGNPPVTFAIAACETQNVNVTVLPCLGLSEGSCVTAKDMWGKMVQDGHFDRENFNTGPSIPSSPGETYCAAVSASAWVEPHGKCTVAFALAWSSPKIKFMKGKSYHRRYTKFYGTSERAASNLVHDALTNYKRWEEEIEKWQAPILRDDRLPEWYKFTLFNELYFLVAGGTVWTDSALLTANAGSNQHQSTATEDMNFEVTEAKVDCKQGALGEHSTVALHNSTAGSRLNGNDETTLMRYGEDEPVISQRRGSKYSRYPYPENDDDDVGGFLYLEGVEYIGAVWEKRVEAIIASFVK